MPPGGGRRPATPKREADLTGLLTPGQKAELVQLVTRVTDRLYKQLNDIFDCPPLSDSMNIQNRLKTWLVVPPQLSLNADSSQSDQKEDTKAPELQRGKDNDLAHQDEARAQGVIEKEEREALTPSMSELKKEVLVHFKKWQTSMLKRVSDISVSNTTQQRQGQGPSKATTVGVKLPHREPKKPASIIEADAVLLNRFPPTPTSLCAMPFEKRKLLLHSMLLLVLSLEHYTSYSRLLLLHMASSLHVPMHTLAEDEVRVAKNLSKVQKEMSAEEATKQRAEENRNSRRWKVGIAGVAGAALIGVTGGLAAPLVAAGIGSILGGIGLGTTAAAGLLGAVAESSVVVGTLFGIYGAKATSKMMDNYAVSVQDFAFLPLHGSLRGEYRDAKDLPPEDRRLRVVIGISGWLTQKEDIVDPWRALGHQSEVYALRWELESLMKMGTSLETVVKSYAWSVAKKEIIARTIFASLFEALWPLSLLKISKIIDNPWSVCMVRADKAGIVLADAIIAKVQGERGVTLIGYSLGARMIYACLMSLAERRAFGLVENAVLIGAPVPSDSRVWCALKSVAAGRLVNVYSQNDYILGFLYRTGSVQYGVAGLQRIEHVKYVENEDVSDIVSGHLRYQYLVGSILKRLGWEDVDYAQVAKDEETLALLDEQMEAESADSAADVNDMDEEAARLEKEVQKKNEQKGLDARMGKMKISH
ncbi:DUF726-domain-containing protein [Pleurostoma richardsiae]|uniref:DUF726-domain-containing protein n=1 Tax=Pleurostoma richardsiae TaxID=41990 RepID=A0AA38S4R5_9PEZI|nr:DUF726-domain-containing protein [Pleurostoma richardsiae]